MIHNFKRISTLLEEERAESLKRRKVEKMKRKLRHELESRHRETGDQERMKKLEAIINIGIERESSWGKCVKETLGSLENSDNIETHWPRDTMFQYLQLMESLMENQQEYEELNLMTKKILLELHDT
jgi:uncharacterized membrane protein YgaE (UPF0421/DUF939 family)